MARAAQARWDNSEQKWLGAVGELYVDKRGRRRRREVALRYANGEFIPKSDRAAALQVFAAAIDVIQREAAKPAFLSAERLVALYLAWFESEVRADRKAFRTLVGHREMLSLFLRECGPGAGPRPAAEFLAGDLRRLVDRLKREGKAANYLNRLIASVGAAWNWAAKLIADRGGDPISGEALPDRLIPSHPFAGFGKERVIRKPVKYAEREEIARFLWGVWRRYSPERSGPFVRGESGALHCPKRGARPWHVWGASLFCSSGPSFGRDAGLASCAKRNGAISTRRRASFGWSVTKRSAKPGKLGSFTFRLGLRAP